MADNIVHFDFPSDTFRCDDLVNITVLSTSYRKATGKRKDPAKFLLTTEAVESIAHLERVTQKSVSNLVVVEHGVGTWVHPDLAEIFAQWCSVEYRFAVVSLIRKEKENPATQQRQLPQDYIAALKALVESEEQKQLQAAQIAILEEETNRQAEIIDELFDYSSIIRIAKYNEVDEKSFNWRQLKAASVVKKIEVKTAPCPRYGTKNLYHHDVWRLAYPGINLPETTTLTIKQGN